MKRTLLALGGVVILLLTTGCGSTGHRTSASTSAPTAGLLPTTTTSTDPPTTVAPTTTTTAPNPTVVPSHITAAYVDAVLAKLNHVYGNGVRSAVVGKRVTMTAVSDIAAIYSTRLGQNEIKLLEDALKHVHDIRPNPGDPVTSVRRLISHSSTCIFALVRTRYNAVVTKPSPLLPDEYLGLSRAPTPRDSLNDTPWIIFFDLVNKTFTKVPSQCPYT